MLFCTGEEILRNGTRYGNFRVRSRFWEGWGWEGLGDMDEKMSLSLKNEFKKCPGGFGVFLKWF